MTEETLQPARDSQKTNPTVECLNRIFKAEPSVVNTLIHLRVPCEEWIVDDPQVIAYTDKNGKNWLGALGVLNGVLAANGLPLVAASYNSFGDLVEFCEPEILGMKND